MYINQQRTKVIIVQTDDGEWFPYRYETVYAKKLTLNKGVDNVLLFEFINQEEKPVNISGSTFTFRVISTDGNELLLEKPMVIINPSCGRAKVTLDNEDLLELYSQQAYYSISRRSGNLHEAVYTDSESGARAPLQLVDSIFPAFIPSAKCTIPTTEITSQESYSGTSYNTFPGWANPYYAGYRSMYSQGPVSGSTTEYFSSFAKPTTNITTFQMTLLHYTGTIKAQWADNYQSIWHNVGPSETYLNESRTIYMNVMGRFPLLRLCFDNSVYSTPRTGGYPATAVATCINGMVSQIDVIDGGAGYMAPPMVEIFGNGAGATAEAFIDANGSVTSINVLTTGEGYWPVPNVATNPAAFPVPIQSSGASVILSTGYVVNILYR